MKHITPILFTALAGATLLTAQEERRPDRTYDRQDPQQHMSVRTHVAASDVLGAKVRLRANVVDRDETGAAVRDKDRPTGEIKDLVLDTNSGKGTWAIVSVGGLLGIGDREVAVPASALQATRDSDGKPVYDLGATEAELKGLPPFDVSAAKKNGLGAAVRDASAAWQKARPDGSLVKQPADASGTRPDDAGRDQRADSGMGIPAHAVLASQLKGIAVRCSDSRDKDYASVDECCMDPDDCSVSFLVIGRGGVIGIGETDYLVPFRATRVVLLGDDQKPTLTVAKSTAEMESAPKYQKPESGLLGDDNARTSCQFYGVEPGTKAWPKDGKDGTGTRKDGGKSGR